jgi:hypothetical protein
MGKLRKLIDISTDDVVALQILAARKGQSLKVMIEVYLHQLAEYTIREELEKRINDFKK